MTDVALTTGDIISVLKAVAEDMRAHVDELRDIDAAAGDGDLGVTITLGADALSAYLAAPDETDTGRMLMKCGMALNRANPSTFGTLLASAFMGAGKAVADRPHLTAADIAALGRGAVDGLSKRTKAEVGDKTVMDAVIPAVAALEQGIGEGEDFAGTLDKAAAAAEAGMNATTAMKAKFGRASWRTDGAVGLKDGGATAMYYLIKSFTTHLAGAAAG